MGQSRAGLLHWRWGSGQSKVYVCMRKNTVESKQHAKQSLGEINYAVYVTQSNRLILDRLRSVRLCVVAFCVLYAVFLVECLSDVSIIVSFQLKRRPAC